MLKPNSQVRSAQSCHPPAGPADPAGLEGRGGGAALLSLLDCFSPFCVVGYELPRPWHLGIVNGAFNHVCTQHCSQQMSINDMDAWLKERWADGQRNGHMDI